MMTTFIQLIILLLFIAMIFNFLKPNKKKDINFMKKLILILLTILTLNSCTEDKSKTYTYTLKYVVFYPNHTDTVEVNGVGSVRWYSYKGSNYIDEYTNSTSKTIYSGNSDYKILNYTVKEK